MSYRRPVDRTERPEFPDVVEEIDEDPARFLDADDGLLVARLSGIDRVEVAREWTKVEVALAEQQDRKPRKQVIAALNRRIKYLQHHGDRLEQLKKRREVLEDDDDQEEAEDVTWKHTKCGSTDVDVLKAGMSWECNECEMMVPKNRVEVV